jgi:hypothetical protein
MGHRAGRSDAEAASAPPARHFRASLVSAGGKRKDFYDAFERLHLLELKPLPGAADIAWASNAGFYLGVVSNKRGPYLPGSSTWLG